MYRFLQTKKGFTLVELMIVVAIMGVLIAIAVPVFNASMADARKKECRTAQQHIVSVTSNWLAKNNKKNVSCTFTITNVNGKGVFSDSVTPVAQNKTFAVDNWESGTVPKSNGKYEITKDNVSVSSVSLTEQEYKTAVWSLQKYFDDISFCSSDGGVITVRISLPDDDINDFSKVTATCSSSEHNVTD